MAPITTPLWALANQMFGLWLLMWIVIPILNVTDAFGLDSKLGSSDNMTYYLGTAMNTPALFTNTGVPIATQSLVQAVRVGGVNGSIRYELNQMLYDSIQPIRMTTYFAIEYATSFIVFAAALTHVYLWYGEEILARFRASLSELDVGDVHAELMDKYFDVPDSWYISLLVVNVVLGMVVCELGGFDLPWWCVILALLLAVVTMIPIGTILAISGQSIGINVMSEFLIGLILPGRMISVMSFKTLSIIGLTLLGIISFSREFPNILRTLAPWWAQGSMAIMVSFFLIEWIVILGRDASSPGVNASLIWCPS